MTHISAYAAVGMRDFFEQSPEDSIVEKICDYLKIPAQKVKAGTRKPDIVYARYWCAWFLIQKTDLTLVAIGQYLGGRDHSTICAARNKVAANLEDAGYTDHEKYLRDYEQLIQILI